MGKEMNTEVLNHELLARKLNDSTPEEILEWALERFDNMAISFSGAEDVVLIDMAVRIKPDVKVFSLDTGRLHPETYAYIENVREHYGIEIDVLSPDTEAVQALVREKGLFSFYKDGHKECCAVRKVGPLRNKLATLDAWVTGQRRDQSVGTRTELPVVQKDGAFSTDSNVLSKFNPLASWSSEDIWDYIRENDVPYNPLHRKGFTSIGCEPCTRAILPNQHEREGRWWWENPDEKECGLHVTNLREAS